MMGSKTNMEINTNMNNLSKMDFTQRRLTHDLQSTKNANTTRHADHKRQKGNSIFSFLAFYYKQMSFVENKFSKITKEIDQREK